MSFEPVRHLLAISADAKTIKGNKLGVMTGVMYLAPHNLSGFQVCPKASEGCKLACLYTAGRGVYTNCQNSRINKTKWFFLDRDGFMERLVLDVKWLIGKAKRANMIPAIRLNGTSDIAWEKISCIKDGIKYASIMEAFPEIQFYDYSAILGRTKALQMRNYHLTFSLKENNDKEAAKALAQGYNVAVVMRLGRTEPKPAEWSGYPVVNGDETDVRFFDPKHGHVIGLFPKGRGRKDTSGFVREVTDNLAA